MRTEPIIGVQDVAKSSEWYQKLLDCKSNHGGDTFEILINKEGIVLLCLHKWGEHDHPTLTEPRKSAGNGLILYIRVESVDDIWRRAINLNATIEKKPAISENSGRREFAIRDLDNYYLLISE